MIIYTLVWVVVEYTLGDIGHQLYIVYANVLFCMKSEAVLEQNRTPFDVPSDPLLETLGMRFMMLDRKWKS